MQRRLILPQTGKVTKPSRKRSRRRARKVEDKNFAKNTELLVGPADTFVSTDAFSEEEKSVPHGQEKEETSSIPEFPYKFLLEETEFPLAEAGEGATTLMGRRAMGRWRREREQSQNQEEEKASPAHEGKLGRRAQRRQKRKTEELRPLHNLQLIDST